MADFLLVHDPLPFAQRLLVPLADAWSRRSFLPCRPFAPAWLAAALDFAHRYHLHADDLLLPRLDGLAFDRTLWRALAGELLLVTALDIPPLPPHAEALPHLLAPTQPSPDPDHLPALAPIHQALRGSRDLVFGVATYRPGRAGLNTPHDVTRLADYLDAIDPEAWSPADLAGLPNLPEEDCAFELDYARDCLDALAGLYRRAAAAGQLIVCESIW